VDQLLAAMAKRDEEEKVRRAAHEQEIQTFKFYIGSQDRRIRELDHENRSLTTELNILATEKLDWEFSKFNASAF